MTAFPNLRDWCDQCGDHSSQWCPGCAACTCAGGCDPECARQTGAPAHRGEPAMTQPIAIRVTRYQCPHCHRTHSKKLAAEAHMGRCWHNPHNRGCKTCKYYEPAGDGTQCVPGDQCTCNSHPESCTAGPGRDLTQPITGCPLWQSLPWSGTR